MRISLLAKMCWLLLLAATTAQAEQITQKAAANTVAEWSFTSQKTYRDPFNEVLLDVVFTTPKGDKLRVPAFWAGGQTWRVRYASGLMGSHYFRTECSDTTNVGLHGVTGRLTVFPYRGGNPLYRHGPIHVARDKRHFEHADGTAFLWLGDTWWMALSSRLKWPQDFQALTADRASKGFNVIQIVAGLYPEMAPLDPNGANEAGLPWETDYSHIRPEYFDAADRRLRYLVEAGMSPCIVGAWGYFLPFMGEHRLEQHWRYLIARYGAFPVIWCVAGEANLAYYKAPGFPREDADQIRGWTEICRYVHRTDPYHRVLTVHPTGLGRLTARGAILDPSVLDYDMLQTGHGGLADLAPTLATIRASYTSLPTLPIVEGEVNYEAILGPDYNNASIQRLFFWGCLLSGVAGYTYGGNGIWQVNLEGRPPITFGSYPTPTWNVAMRLPGSGQIGRARKLLLRYPWHRFEPHPEWASVSPEEPVRLTGSSWVWYPEGNPAQDAPAQKRFFRRVFTLPADKAIQKARLKITADDTFTAFLNGHELGSYSNWRTGRTFSGLQRLLRPGRNVLAIEAENIASAVLQNPAGLIAKLEVEYADGTTITLSSDASWRASKTEQPGWREVGFDDSEWPAAMQIVSYGQGPWGQAGSDTTPSAPFCAGTPKGFRIAYLPTGKRVTFHHLEKGMRYRATWIDPITGNAARIGSVHAGREGAWVSPDPPGPDQDWTLVLEPEKQ